MKSLHLSIAGAGIGGLTLALALEQRGHIVQLIEKRDVFGAEGAGILLAANALKCLEPLGVVGDIRAKGMRIEQLEIRGENDRVIRAAAAVDTVAIHRDTLHTILRNKLSANITMGCDVLPKDSVDLRVGADGIHSAVRNEVAKTATFTDSQQVCWRTVVDVPRHDAIEYWSRNRRVGLIPIDPEKTYIYLVLSGPDALRLGNPWGSREQLIEAFAQIAPSVDDALQLIDITTLRRDAMKQLEVTPWYSDNTVLIGDAAHAMTPNMGQGACQAIEDAIFLADALTEIPSIPEALARYVEVRQPRVNWVQRESWRIGSLAHINSSIGRWFRDAALRHMPRSLDKRMMDRLMTPSSLHAS